MKITIIGWYGTETIGDRAILAGLISFFNKAYADFEIKLGSLYPFFTERTLNEDYSFYKEIIDKNCKIEIFDSKKSSKLDKAIKNSDLVVMGGGPLMDLDELFMVEYAFKRAKKLGKKTALLGCGIGPLFQKKYRKSVLGIVKYSDQILLRDTASHDNLEAIFFEFKQKINSKEISVSYDPAVECAIQFLTKEEKSRTNYITVNLREFPVGYSKENRASEINASLKNFMAELAGKYPEREIKLIPMHYFHIGGDDRLFLNKIALELGLENIKVQNVNLTLNETMKVFQDAYFNIGMRFHSVVLQTIVSGYNYILDYTEPKKGKIPGFIQDIDKRFFYQDRYISLQQDAIDSNIINNVNSRFEMEQVEVENRLSIYQLVLRELAS